MNKRWVVVAVNVVLLGIALLFYPQLPERVPSHWDLHGKVDGTMSKFPGAFLGSLMSLAVLLLLPLLRRIDPRRASYEKMEPTFYLVVNIVALMLAMVQGLTLAVSLGMRIDMLRAMLFGAGLMFVLLGNYMPRLRANWWMGIRTPWTLDSDEVWRRTHRLGGRLFVGAGAVTMVATLLPREAASAIAAVSITTAALIPVIYSYLVWRTERRERTDA